MGSHVPNNHYLFGLTPVTRMNAISDSDLQRGIDVKELLRRQEKPVTPEMQIAMLYMHQAMKTATIHHLRNSVGIGAGGHLQLVSPKQETPPLHSPSSEEVAATTKTFREGLPKHRKLPIRKNDPFAVQNARLHEMHAELREHIQENLSEMKSCLNDAFTQAANGRQDLANIALEDMLYIGARTFVLFKRTGVSARDARALMHDICEELLSHAFHVHAPEGREAPAQLSPIMHTLMDNFFLRNGKTR